MWKHFVMWFKRLLMILGVLGLLYIGFVILLFLYVNGFFGRPGPVYPVSYARVYAPGDANAKAIIAIMQETAKTEGLKYERGTNNEPKILYKVIYLFKGDRTVFEVRDRGPFTRNLPTDTNVGDDWYDVAIFPVLSSAETARIWNEVMGKLKVRLDDKQQILPQDISNRNAGNLPYVSEDFSKAR